MKYLYLVCLIMCSFALFGCGLDDKRSGSQVIEIEDDLSADVGDDSTNDSPNDSDSEEQFESFVCGNGILEPGELCDGSCPTCEEDACRTMERAGATETCNVVCVPLSTITVCQDDDECCPSSCEYENDNDCICVPLTCDDIGAVCGQVNDGCGGTVSCGMCAIGSCVNGSCVTERPTGTGCDSNDQCISGEVFPGECLNEPGGYCSRGCGDFALYSCDAGDVCSYALPDTGICRTACVTDGDCRDGYVCADTSLNGDVEKGCLPISD